MAFVYDHSANFGPRKKRQPKGKTKTLTQYLQETLTNRRVPIRGYAGAFNRNDMVVAAADYDKLEREYRALLLVEDRARYCSENQGGGFLAQKRLSDAIAALDAIRKTP